MSEPTEQKKEEKTNYTRQLLKWGAVVLGFWLLYLALLFWADDICAYFKYTPHINHSSTFGVFGDYFGALNALFAGLAFAGIIVTIHQQSADLKATKDEMQNQTTQFAKQTELIQKQIAKQEENFREQRYFNLITRLDKIRGETAASHNSKGYLKIIEDLEALSVRKDLGGYVPKREMVPLLAAFGEHFNEWEFVYHQMFELLAIIANDKELGEKEKKIWILRVKSGFSIPDTQILAIVARAAKTQNPLRDSVKKAEEMVFDIFDEEIMIDYFTKQGKAFMRMSQTAPDEPARSMAIHFIKILESGAFDTICTENTDTQQS